MPTVSMRQLLEAGVHFGHQTRRWNPKMRPFIFAERNGIHIIDLAQTVKRLDSALEFVTETVARGDSVLFVGTKKQAQEPVMQEAIRAGQPYVTKRWLGGMLTNFVTIKKRIGLLDQLEARQQAGDFDRLPKKEAALLTEELNKLSAMLGGIRKMKRLPGAVFIVDPHRERIAVTESNKLEIPVVGTGDTNVDPDELDYIIPANDDAIRAIRLLCQLVADAAIEGARERAARATAEPEVQEPQAMDEPEFDESAAADLVAQLTAGGTLSFNPDSEDDDLLPGVARAPEGVTEAAEPAPPAAAETPATPVATPVAAPAEPAKPEAKAPVAEPAKPDAKAPAVRRTPAAPKVAVAAPSEAAPAPGAEASAPAAEASAPATEPIRPRRRRSRLRRSRPPNDRRPGPRSIRPPGLLRPRRPRRPAAHHEHKARTLTARPRHRSMISMAITAATVKELRERTGAGMMDCKRALEEAGGDLEAAVALLRERGIASAAKKASRDAREGLVSSYIHTGGRVGVLIEVNCETDFVARTDDFQRLVRDLAIQVAGLAPIYVDVENIPAADLEARKAELLADPSVRSKPEAIREKIIDGQLHKWYRDVCLLEQPFRDEDRSVRDLVTEKIATIGENIRVRRFTRYALGEEM